MNGMEYTQSQAEQLRNETALRIGLLRTRVSLPGVGFMINADADGFEVLAKHDGGTVVPYTAWGDPSQSVETMVAVSRSIMDKLNIPVAAMSCEAVLSTARYVFYGLCDSLMDGLTLGLANGNRFNPDRSEYGVEYASVAGLQTKCDYMLARCRLCDRKEH